MNDAKTRALENISECNDMEISVTNIFPANRSLELDTLTFKDNGVIVFSGDYELKVNKIYNLKKTSVNNGDDSSYEFIIAGEDGENGRDAAHAGKVNILVKEIDGDIRILAAAGKGCGGKDGVDGMNGGDGGNGYQGGDGGSGGDALAGTNGSSGGNAPDLNLTYSSLNGDSSIYVNGEKAKQNHIFRIEGGKGGKGGNAAAGGKGGRGGKGIDPLHNGKDGKDGMDAKGGIDGKDGEDGFIKIKKRPIAERLEEHRGLYVFDLTDDEEYEYCMSKLGGKERLMQYGAVSDALKKSRLKKRGGTKSEDNTSSISVTFNGNSFYDAAKNKRSVKSDSNGSDFKRMCKNFSIDLFDTKTEPAENIAASKWKVLTITLNVVNKSCPTGAPIISQSFEASGSYGGTKDFWSESLKTEDFEGTLVTVMEIRGINAEGKYVEAEYRDKEQFGKEIMQYTVTDIKVSDPKWNKKYDDGIIMLYGRTNEQDIYSKADYVGGDYEHNTVKPNKEIATLIPFKGRVTFSNDYTPVGITPPDDAITFLRPSLNYDNKSAGKRTPDIVYQNDITDNSKLYKLWTDQECFKACPGVVDPHVDFDLSLDRNDKTSKLDWHHNITGDADGNKRTVLLRGNFGYRLHRNGFPDDKYTDIQISVASISKENLEENNKNLPPEEKREYYSFLNGSNLIYIPPIHIYWGCLGKDVLLKTADKKEKTAESVKIGDKLLSHDGRTVTVEDIYTGRDETILRLKCKGGYETLMSGAHPVLDKNGKGVPVRSLKAGDKIMTENGGTAEVISVTEEPYNDTVYNFTFAGESESVYIIADGIYAGDLNAQNAEPEEPRETEEEKELTRKLTEEMHIICKLTRSRVKC
ncbi:MAG: hypothetical protein HDT48_02595 [Ruminococcaceae bacterium]|nr:hypothetical protein [Oscillospiraceae bacterium]